MPAPPLSRCSVRRNPRLRVAIAHFPTRTSRTRDTVDLVNFNDVGGCVHGQC